MHHRQSRGKKGKEWKHIHAPRTTPMIHWRCRRCWHHNPHRWKDILHLYIALTCMSGSTSYITCSCRVFSSAQHWNPLQTADSLSPLNVQSLIWVLPGFGIALHPSNPTIHQKSKHHKWRPAQPPGRAPHVVPGGSTQNPAGKFRPHRWSISWSHLTPVTPRPLPWSHETVSSELWLRRLVFFKKICNWNAEIKIAGCFENVSFSIFLRVGDCWGSMFRFRWISSNLHSQKGYEKRWLWLTVGCLLAKSFHLSIEMLQLEPSCRPKKKSGFWSPHWRKVKLFHRQYIILK